MVVDDFTGFKFILNFEYVAILVLLILLAYMFIEKLIVLRRSRIFTAVIIFSIISASFDIFRAMLVNNYNAGKASDNMIGVANILQTTYLLFFFAAIFMYVMYVVVITCSLSYVNKKKLMFIAFYLPAIAALGITVANYFTTTIMNFKIDGSLNLEVNVICFGILAGIGVYYVFFAIYLMGKFRSIFEKREIISISVVLPLILTGLAAEIIAPRLLVLFFMVSLSIILVQTVMESYEDIIDDGTTLYNIAEFIKRVKRVYITKDDKYVVLIKMKNFQQLITTYDNEEVAKYMLGLTKRLNAKRKQTKIRDDLYYLNNGYYASVVEKSRYKQDGSSKMFEYVESGEYCVDFVPMMERCITEPVKDFETVDELIAFVNNYRKTITFKNPITVYKDVKDDKNLTIINNLESIIDTGLKEKEFVVYYQPIYSIKGNKFKTAEALVRLNSKKYGFISPGTFIPYAEDTGRIEEIDTFVMEEVFKFVSSSVFSVLGLDYIEINLSMAECVNKKLVDRITELMEKYSVDPKNINLEITESFDTYEQDIINKNLNRLVEMGFRFSLDDYGTGYSNISRFSSLPISIVKIDKSLVDESEDKNVKKILEYSFNLVKDLKKQTVVEGVETKEQLERFKEYGATYIQGFYFSKPLDYESYIEFIREKN